MSWQLEKKQKASLRKPPCFLTLSTDKTVRKTNFSAYSAKKKEQKIKKPGKKKIKT